MKNEMFKEMYNGSWFTIEGIKMSDHEIMKKEITKIFNEREIGIPQKWYSFTGKEMNTMYNLTGSNQYKDDLGFLACSLDGLYIPKLAMFRLVYADRFKWFDDIVDNNQRREKNE